VPFKSKAQRRKFAELLVKGEISPETFEEWSRETGSAKLPERAPRKRVGRKRGAGRKKGGTASKNRGTTRRKRASKGASRSAGKRKSRSSVRKAARKRKR
jgi:hypothetical protein